jgi:hypothetical protein
MQQCQARGKRFGAMNQQDCEAGPLAKGRELVGANGERDRECAVCRVCWNGVNTMFFIFYRRKTI